MEDMSELTAEEQAKLLRHELEAVYGSSSYKIGRAVTWLPRNAKRGLKYLLHNGPVVSAKYIYTYAKYHKIAKRKLRLLGLPAKKGLPRGAEKMVPGDKLHSHTARPRTPQILQREDPVAQAVRRVRGCLSPR